MSDLLDRYLATWNETDRAQRRDLLERHWAADASYTDPLVAVRGHDEIAATVAAVQKQFPGFVFTAYGDVDSHHDHTRFQWGLGPAGEEPVVVGSDVVVTDAEGRIETVLGFLDRVPGGAD